MLTFYLLYLTIRLNRLSTINELARNDRLPRTTRARAGAEGSGEGALELMLCLSFDVEERFHSHLTAR